VAKSVEETTRNDNNCIYEHPQITRKLSNVEFVVLFGDEIVADLKEQRRDPTITKCLD
jgi:hypothetical protein